MAGAAIKSRKLSFVSRRACECVYDRSSARRLARVPISCRTIASARFRSKASTSSRSGLPTGNGAMSWRHFPLCQVGRTGVVHDLIAPILEGADPLIERPRTSGARPLGEARDSKQVAQLGVRQLDEQIGEELAASFADARMVERPRLRSGDVPDAGLLIRPDSRARPLLEVHAADRGAIVDVRVPEGQTEIADHHEGVEARLTVLPRLLSG